MASKKDDVKIGYDTALVFWRIITQIFFREIRPRGAFNIPRDGPVIVVVAPHHNQARTYSTFVSDVMCLL
jgi:glycerol-3-phosphate O-acyltransferase/dihydroxyacetone phosphate acyltransferase